MIMLLMRKVVRVIIRLVVLIMLLLLLLPGKLAYGQSTPEPTNTPYSPYNTPVAPGDPGNMCPAGTPLPTPLSMQYYDLCGQCVDSDLDNWLVTPIPFGTLPPYGFTPGALTPTVEGTVTVSPTPQNDILDGVLRHSGIPVPIEIPTNEYLTNPSTYNIYGGINISNDAVPGGTVIKGSLKIEYAYDIKNYLNENYQDYIILVVHAVGNTPTTINCISGCTGVSNLIGSQTIYGDYFTIGGGGSGTIILEFEYTPGYYYNTLGFEFIVRSGKNGSLSATYTYTGQGSEFFDLPVPDYGYCASYDYQDDDTLVDYPGIIIRQGECIVIIPDFAINLPAVGENIPAVEWGIQGFSICPKWVDLGEIKVAEFEIPVDIVALPALVFIMWLIFVF